MSTIEILIVSDKQGSDTALSAYEGARVATGPSINFAQRMVMSDQPPQAIVVDDSKGTIEELWSLVRACQTKRVPIYVGLFAAGIARAHDFRDAGIALAPDEVLSGQQFAAWVAQQLGLRERASKQGQVVIAVAGAKGGIGKTLLVTLIAEGLARRGLRVGIVDADVSNSGVVPAFRIDSGFPSFLQAKGDGPGAWTPDNLRKYIYRHKRTAISFLLGSDETARINEDLTWQDWQQLMQAVRSLDEFDVIVVDTGPEMLRRPYALEVAANNGFVVFPVPPGRRERNGAYNALQFIASHSTPEVDLIQRCLLVFMQPEKGVTLDATSIQPKFAHLFPNASILGILPRASRQVSIADEEGDAYISPLDVSPWSPFSLAVYDLVEAICQRTALHPPLAKPKPNVFQRLFGGRRFRHAADVLQNPIVVNQ